MSDACLWGICYSKALFNSITDVVVLTMKTSFFARLLIPALSVAALSSAAYADDLNIKTMIPGVPQIDAESYILIDYNSGKVLAEQNADSRRDPASLTKMMTSYVIGQAMKAGKFKESDLVTIGNDAWATGNPVFKGSSLMFLKPGMQVPVSQLIRGINLQSGNDACVAMADYVAGSQDAFVGLMNSYVTALGLQNTHFQTVHGLDADGQYSSARDMAMIGQALIRDVPNEYSIYKEKEFTFNGIRQLNRNGLLWEKSMNIDGLKTGHTSGAGFNLIASAVDGQRRLIAVVMGADSAKGREDQARTLLHWGQQNFDTVQILQNGKKVGTERIWYGDKEQIKLGTDQDFWLALPKAEVSRIKAKYVLDKKDLEAPIAANQRVGEISLYDGDKVVGHYPLVTLESINKGGVFSRMSDYLHQEL